MWRACLGWFMRRRRICWGGRLWRARRVGISCWWLRQRGEAGHADYAASKGALIAFTKSLSSELAPHGIYANCVAPGWTHTDMTDSVFGDPEVAARVNPTIPVGRAGHVDEIA